MKPLLAALALAALPLAAGAQPLVFHTNDPAMAAAMGHVIGLNGQALGAGSAGPGAHAVQTGSGNAAGIAQGGSNNRGVIVQQGCNNNSTVVQGGSNLNAGVFQFTCGSDVHVTQTGSGQATTVIHWGASTPRPPMAGRR
jgi:major curlin subunit